MKYFRNAIFLLIAFVFLTGQSGCLESLGLSKPRDGGFLYTEDGGDNWGGRNTIDEKNDMERFSVSYLTVANQDQQEIFLGTFDKGLYHTNNAGEDWDLTWDVEVPILRIKVDHQENNIVYVVSSKDGRGRLLKSTDRGDNFDEIFVTSSADSYIQYFEMDPFNPKHLYIATESTGLFKSEDGGETWQIRYWFEDPLAMVKVSPTNSDLLFAYTKKDYLISKDQGISWQNYTANIEAYPGALEINDFVFAPSNPSQIFAASAYGLLESKDTGVTWQHVPLIIPPEAVAVVTIAVNPYNPRELVAGATASIYKSTDGGTSWNVKKFNSSKFVTNLIYNTDDTQKIYGSLWSTD